MTTERPTHHYDAIVVGAGVMGCAAARVLARSGRSVLLLEEDAIGHRGSSSHGRTRIMRLSYPDCRYIEMCRASYAAWSALERECDEELFTRTGCLNVSTSGGDELRPLEQAMTQCRVPFEVLDAHGIAERHPQLRPPEKAVALYQSDGGILHADLCLEALVKSARSAGADILEHTKATHIESRADHIAVATTGSHYEADHIVLCTGPAMRETCRQLGLNLQLLVSTEQVVYFEPKDAAAYEAKRMPVVIMHPGQGILASVFPLYRDRNVKAMREWKKPEDSSSSHAMEEMRIQAVTCLIESLLPGISGRFVQVDTCRYTLAPDEHFIVDHHPADSRIIILSACSGHGFKFAPVLATAIDAVTAGRPPQIDLSMFRLDRPGLQATP